MSTVFVAPNAQFTGADPGLMIFGGSGDELVRLRQPATDASINANVERVDFSGVVSSYSFEVSGNLVVIRQAGVVIASVVVQDDADGTIFRFADGAANLLISGLNQVSLGGVALTTTDGGAAIIPAQMGAGFNPGNVSSVGVLPPPPPPPANQPPTAIDLSNSSINENAPGGALVGTLGASDPDSGETFSFVLLDNAGGRFQIVGKQLQVTGSGLDFESSSSHSVTVQVTDSANNTLTKTFTIGVGDLDETSPPPPPPPATPPPPPPPFNPPPSGISLRGRESFGAP